MYCVSILTIEKKEQEKDELSEGGAADTRVDVSEGVGETDRLEDASLGLRALRCTGTYLAGASSAA